MAATTLAHRKMVKQIDKYWDKLFADPILVSTKTGPMAEVFKISNLPQRLLEIPPKKTAVS